MRGSEMRCDDVLERVGGRGKDYECKFCRGHLSDMEVEECIGDSFADENATKRVRSVQKYRRERNSEKSPLRCVQKLRMKPVKTSRRYSLRQTVSRRRFSPSGYEPKSETSETNTSFESNENDDKDFSPTAKGGKRNKRIDRERYHLLGSITNSPIFQARFICSVSDLPLAILLTTAPSYQCFNVCDHVPQIKFVNRDAEFSFILDTMKIEVDSIYNDGLEFWCEKDASGITTKHYFDDNKESCAVGEHVYTVTRTFYSNPPTHPHLFKKIVWFARKGRRVLKFALISYAFTSSSLNESPSDASEVVKVEDIFESEDELVEYGNDKRKGHASNCTSEEGLGYVLGSDDASTPFQEVANQSEDTMYISNHPPLDDEYLKQLTSAPVFKQSFINTIGNLPIDLMFQDEIDESVIPVCKVVPTLNLYGVPAAVSFIVDTREVPVCDLSSDNLGQWNSRDGRRMSVRKFYYKEDIKCSKGVHDLCIIRRKYKHPYATPSNSVSKIIWIIKKTNFCRYALISYTLGQGAYVPLVPHGNSRSNQKGYVRRRPSEVKKRLPKRTNYGHFGDDAISRAMREADINDDHRVSDDELDSDVNIEDETCYADRYSSVNDKVNPIEMDRRISSITKAPIFSRKYVNSIGQLPIELLQRTEISGDVLPVNYSVPQIELSGLGAQMSFIVDCSQIPIAELASDGLGSWNTKSGKRVSVYKFFFNVDNLKCSSNDYEYYALRKKYVHPYASPPDSVRKVIWLLRKADKSYYRYVLITYRIFDDATVVMRPSKLFQRIYQPLPILEPINQDIVNEEIARITESPVYAKRFINSLHDVPIDILLSPWTLNEPVCSTVPLIDLLCEPTKVALQMTFIVDTKNVSVADISTDNLGQWNTSQGRRMTLRKFFFNREKQRCMDNSHDFIVTRKTYVHPNSIPDGAVRKIIWQLTTGQTFTRYALVTFDIGERAMVEAVPHGNSKANREVYIRREPSLMAFRRSHQHSDRSRRIEDESIAVKRVCLSNPSTVSLYADEDATEICDAYVTLTHADLMAHMSQPSSRRYSEPYHNDYSFNVVFLNELNLGQIACATCGIHLHHADPPDDIALEHIERFWNQRTGSYSVMQMQKRYIHARLECVLHRYDYFTTVDYLVIPPDVRMKLTDEHVHHLTSEFGYNFYSD